MLLSLIHIFVDIAGGVFHDQFLRGVLPIENAGHLALVHDEHAVGHAEHLGQLGGDHDDAFVVLNQVVHYLIAVSYTHLDVYKRQGKWMKSCGWRTYPSVFRA